VLVTKRIFWATKKLEIHLSDEDQIKQEQRQRQWDEIAKNLTVYEAPIELPSQQAKQTGEGEQLNDGRVSAATR
jgi:hypothetical protein